MAAAILTAERLREILDYDSTTGEFVWRVCLSTRMPAGKQAGWVGAQGYRVIRIQGKSWYAHRLAWFYIEGRWPEHDIDHIDGNRTNNARANLRDVTRSVNLQNQRRARKRKASGAPLGVVRAGNRWAAQIVVDGALKHLGSFGCPVEAHECYLAAKRKLHVGNTL